MKNILLKNTLFIFLAGICLVSCKDPEKKELDGNSASDNANSQSVFDDMSKVTEDALTQNNSGARMAAPGPGNSISCATVTIDVLATDSTKFTINFTGGTCSDFKTRSGTIVAILDGASYNTPGSVLTITTSDYTVNGHKVVGKKVVTCVSNTNNQPVHNIVVSDTGTAGTGYAVLTYANAKTTHWKSKRTRTLVSGGGDLNITNNIYDISATPGVGNPVASGVNKNGVAYTVDVSNPIRVNFNCIQSNTAKYPTQGVFTLHTDTHDPVTVDYGNGACDNSVKVTFLGKTYDVNLNY